MNESILRFHFVAAKGSLDFFNMSELIPPNEAQRMEAVRRYNILDTPPDGSFDRITHLAARLFQAPIAIVSVVDEDRIWFKSHHGVDATEIPRDPGLCASAILRDEPRLLNDAYKDAHALANPLVAGDFGLRFYLGIPLKTYDGFNLGTLCVIDRKPREVSAEQIANLQDLASVVMDQLELRRSAMSAVGQKSILLEEMSHRVKNSLQAVTGMLKLQGQNQAPETKELFAQAATRVQAVARAYGRLDQVSDFTAMNCTEYLSALCADIAESFGVNTPRIEVEGDRMDLPPARCTLVGLMLNELVTNALKHGNEGGENSRVHVAVRKYNGRYEMTVADNGKGLPEGFDPARSKGLGMRLIKAFVGQLEGEIEFTRNIRGQGSLVTIRFS